MRNQNALKIAGLKGIDERWNADPSSAAILEDATHDPRGGWRECGGYAPIIDFTGGAKINSMFWFSEHNGGPQWLLYEQGANLKFFNGSTASFTTLKSDRYQTSQPWQRSQYVAVGNSCWIVNGENGPLRFHNGVVMPAGFPAPAPALTVEGFADGFILGTSYNNLGLGDAETDTVNGGGEVAYVIVEVNEFGTWSPPSPVYSSVKWQIAAGGAAADLRSKYFTRVRIPKRTGDHIVERILFRTKNARLSGLQDGSTFYRHPRRLRGSKAFTFVDAAPDSYLLDPLDPTNLGPWPQGAKFLAFFKGCLFAAGMTTDPDRVVYSRSGMIEAWPILNYFSLGHPDSGEITGLYATRNALVAFKRRGIFLIMGDPVTGFTAKTLTLDVGCSAPNTLKEVPGIGLVWASDAGVYAMAGVLSDEDTPGRPFNISEGLQDTWQWRVNLAALANASAVVYHAHKEYWLSVPMDGQPDNELVFALHYEARAPGDAGQWSTRPNMHAACMVETHDHRGHLYIGSNGLGHPGIHHYGHGYSSKDGDDIAFRYRSVPIDFSGTYGHTSINELVVQCLTYGNPDIVFTTYADRKPSQSNQNVQSRDQQDPEDILPVWGTASWSTTETWYRQKPTTIRIGLDVTCKEFQWEVTAAVSVKGTSSNRIQILGALIAITPGEGYKTLDVVLNRGTPEMT